MHWVKVCGVLGPRVSGFRVEGLGWFKGGGPRFSSFALRVRLWEFGS